MRAPVRLISAVLVLALASCGGDGENRAANGKQSTISAKAYPAVEQFVTSSVSCKKLADVSRQDRIASVVAKTCPKGRAFIRSAKIVPLLSRRCAKVARTRQASLIRRCIADRGEPLMRKVLSDFEHLAKTYNSDLEEVVKPGACLEALKLRESAIDAIARARRALPAAMKRVRSGDVSDLDSIFGQINLRVGPAPTPCKP